MRLLSVLWPGSVDLNDLDTVGGGARDVLNVVCPVDGRAEGDRLRSVHDALKKYLLPGVLAFFPDWSLSDTEHCLCEDRNQGSGKQESRAKEWQKRLPARLELLRNTSSLLQWPAGTALSQIICRRRS